MDFNLKCMDKNLAPKGKYNSFGNTYKELIASFENLTGRTPIVEIPSTAKEKEDASRIKGMQKKLKALTS